MTELTTASPNMQGKETLHNFSAFEPEVAALHARLAEVPAAEIANQAGWAGSGNTVNAFLVETPHGPKIVRLLKPGVDPSVVHRYEANLRPGVGRPCHEQFDAASETYGAVVSEPMVGTNLGRIDAPVNQATEDQIDDLFGAVIDGHADNIVYDMNPENIFYDPESSFGLIDYSNADVVGPDNLSDGTLVGETIAGLVGLSARELRPTTVEECQRIHAALQQRAELLAKALAIAEKRLTAEQYAECTDALRVPTEILRSNLDYFSRPESVLATEAKLAGWG